MAKYAIITKQTWVHAGRWIMPGEVFRMVRLKREGNNIQGLKIGHNVCAVRKEFYKTLDKNENELAELLYD